MCTYSISIDDALMEQVRPSIAKGMEESQWMQQQIELWLIQFVKSTKKNRFDESYMSNLITMSAPAWKDVMDADQWVHELRGE
jgi:hypothetical protein